MSDFNSSLPVRTEHNGDVVINLADGTNETQLLAVDAAGKITTKLDDAAGNGLTSQANGGQQALDVGIDVGGVQIDPRSIRALTSADVVTVDQGTSPWVTNLTQVGGSAIALGQHVMASSLPVVIASDQSAIPVTQSGSWTVTSNQGTSPWITKDVADGSVAPGTAGTFSQLAGAVYSSTPPTLTNGQQVALQVDASGRLITDSTVTFPYDENYGTVGATTLRTASQIGNATGAADFNAGATGAQTLRTTSNQGAPNTVANSWPMELTNGTNIAQVSAGGELSTTISTPLPAGTNSIGTVVVSNLPTTVDTNYGTVGANTIRTASQIGNATGAANFGNGATGAQTLRVAANLAVGGADVTALNPVPVTLEAAPGTTIADYKDASSIAANASDNHDYTVTAGKTFYFDQVIAAGSGKTKMEVQIETGVATNVFTSKFVQFNSTADTSMDFELLNAIPVAAGVRVRLIMTNIDKGAQDLYSTICGSER